MSLSSKVSLFSHIRLCDPMDHSPPGSSVHEILQASIVKWVAMPSSRGSSWSRDWTHISYFSWIDRQVLYHKCHLGSPLSTVALCKDHGDIEIKVVFYLQVLTEHQHHPCTWQKCNPQVPHHLHWTKNWGVGPSNSCFDKPSGGFPDSSVRNESACQCRETQFWSLGQEDPLEKEMATYSSILAWRIPLQFMGSQRHRHNWVTKLPTTTGSFWEPL